MVNLNHIKIKKQPKRKEPLWKGPEEDGITYSLLCRFLNCRERFRLLVVDGLAVADSFNHRLEYGNMWHLCEEHKAADPTNKRNPRPWEGPLKEYARELCRRYPMQQADVEHWYNVCRVQFPIYVEYWARHPHADAKPLLQEYSFRVPYRLPSGRTVTLRGKWDSVDVLGPRRGHQEVWLMENKTKGDIRPEQLQRQLTFDLQTMLYLTAMVEGRYEKPLAEIWPKGLAYAGVRYNVIRRPLSGGKGTIVRKQARGSTPEETKAHYYERVRKIIDGTGEDAPGPDHFFMRWEVRVTQQEIDDFRRQCLDPILEQLCDWWQHVEWSIADRSEGDVWSATGPFGPVHWRHPFGVWNVLDEGGSSELDNYLSTGSTVGLGQIDDLFPELK